MSSSNSNSSPQLLPLRPAPPPTATILRNSPSSCSNVLGLTTGWGIGISNSRQTTTISESSYLSSKHVRMSVPVVSTEISAATYEGIRSIIREALALRRASQKIKQERERRSVALAAGTNNVEDCDGKEWQWQFQTTKRTKEKIKNELNMLLRQRTELEEIVQHQWKENIDDFVQSSLEQEKEEMNELRKEHERELRQLVETMKAGQEQPTAEDTSRKEKRKAARQDVDESRKKSLKVGKECTTGLTKDGRHDETSVVGVGKSRDTELDKDNGPGNGDSENERVSLQSAEKAKELKEIQNEMNHLNKTKSQMIWLLKQVITAEKKQKFRYAAPSTKC